MKYTFLLISVLLTLTSQGQRIDDLRNKAEVSAFFAQKIDSILGDPFAPFRSETTGDPLPPPAPDPTLPIQDSFMIADLDGNGLNDLLINHYGVLIAVSDEGNNKYHSSMWLYCNLLHLVDTLGAKQPLMVVRRIEQRMLAPREVFIDSFILRSGNLVEYNPQPDTVAIYCINYSILCDNCDNIPAFEMSIGDDRSATLNALLVPSMADGVYRGIIDSAVYTPLIHLMQYLDLRGLKESYSGYASDQPWAILEVQYADGSVKQIIDDGLYGTPGLRVLHQQFKSLLSSQQWIK